MIAALEVEDATRAAMSTEGLAPQDLR